jgi:hypothetical protein
MQGGMKILVAGSNPALLFLSALLVLLLSHRCGMAAPRDDGLIVYYAFDDGAGSVLKDSSGKGLHGKIIGAGWTLADHVSCLSFDGRNSYVDSANGSALNFTDALTIEAWILVDEVPAGESLIAGKDTSSYALTFYKDGNCWFYAAGSGHAVLAPVMLHIWQHVAGTYDGQRMALYVNGELLAAQECAGKIAPSAADLAIGKGPSYFKGKIAGVKIYGRALSEDEIRRDYRLHGRRARKQSSRQIVIGGKADMVERTAAEELALFFEDRYGEQVPVCVEDGRGVRSGSILLGTVQSSAAIKEAYGTGAFRELDPAGTGDDAFEVTVRGGAITIAGQTPRGVLYGAYYVDEYARRHDNELPADGSHVYRKPFFRVRTTTDYNSVRHVFNEEDVRYFSRLGYTHMSVNWWGLPITDNWGISAWADSSVFPSVKTSQNNIETVHKFVRTARKYGIEGLFYLCEPQSLLVLYGGDMKRLGGDELLGRTQSQRTTCVNSPKVQEHYRSLMGNLLRDFPEIGLVLVYDNDGSFWSCDPNLCPRCAASLKKQKPPYKGVSNWELTSSFINLLQQAANEARPGVHVVAAAFNYLDDTAQYVDNLVPGAGAVVPTHHGDGWIWSPVTPEIQDRLRPVASRAEEKGVSFGLVDELTQSEKLGFAMSCPWPRATYNKLHGYAGAGVRCLFEQCTPFPYAQSVNALVFKECIWDPNQDEDALLRRLATDQFGEAAGAHMFQAWGEMKETFGTLFTPGSTWSGAYLMCGNLAIQWGMFRPLTVSGLRSNPDRYFSSTGYAHFPTGFRNATSLKQIQESTAHLRQAVAHAKQAVEVAPEDRKPFYAFCFSPRSNLTCREYAEEQYHCLNFQRYIFESNINFIEAELLVRENKDGEAQKVIDRQNAATKEILETSAAYMAEKIGLLHDAVARVTAFGVLKDRHPVIQKLRWVLAPEVHAERKTVVAPMLEASPRMDGVLDDDVWKQAGRAEGFTRHGVAVAAQVPTVVWVYRDAENLFLAFECSEPEMSELVARPRPRDGAVYSDDCVDIFLAPGSPGAGTYHLLVNALGSQYDERDGDPAWNGDWECAASRSATSWSVEIKIPFRVLGAVPKKGDVWRCNFNRERQGWNSELSSWSPTQNVFAEPEHFGEIVF